MSKTPSTPKMVYKVRKSLEDTKSQLSCYSNMYNAISKAKENPGYNVYDIRTGEEVYHNEFQEVDDLLIDEDEYCEACDLSKYLEDGYVSDCCESKEDITTNTSVIDGHGTYTFTTDESADLESNEVVEGKISFWCKVKNFFKNLFYKIKLK